MPTVVREDADQLTAVLTVTVNKDEYEPKYKSELNKYRKQAHMKGFRKGKTPMSVVRKLYGKSVLAEVVNHMLQEELYRYLTEEDIEILGQPLPADDQEVIDFDLKHLEDYRFRFDVGLAPQFEVQGIGEDSTFEKYEVDITEEMVEEALDNARRRHGESIESDGPISENDLLQLSVAELEDGEVKEDGVESTFNLLLESVDNEEAKQAFLSREVGDHLELDLFDLEKNTDDDYVRRYFLKLEEDDDREVGRRFQVTIDKASHIEPAALDQEFFDKNFGAEVVSSEEEARAKVREELREYYEQQASAILFRDIQEALMEKNQPELPDEFLHRWLLANNEGASVEDIDAEYDRFAKNLRWSLIRGKLVNQWALEVTQEEVLESFKDRVRSYFGGASGQEELVTSMAYRLMEDQQQYDSVYEDILTDKVAEAIEDHVTIQTQPIEAEAFSEVLEQARLEAEAARRPQAAAREEE